jgi:hypothetical protein
MTVHPAEHLPHLCYHNSADAIVGPLRFGFGVGCV